SFEEQFQFKSNPDFWRAKITRNMERDREVNERLAAQGWHVLRVWESDVLRDTHECVMRVVEALGNRKDATVSDQIAKTPPDIADKGGRQMELAEMERMVAVVDGLIEAEAGDYYGNRQGACDQVNGILARVARNLGYPAILIRGYVGDEDAAHVWVRIGDLNIDLAGEQFGRERVRSFTTDPDYHAVQTELPGERTQMYAEDEAIVQRATAALRIKSRVKDRANKSSK
ncbi:MAG TPA: hypothetical protein VKQ30_12560, partial [Ktedonobacterales bacterium]|nr:hypothetical protein [Ktedonobacterales bacterium]